MQEDGDTLCQGQLYKLEPASRHTIAKRACEEGRLYLLRYLGELDVEKETNYLVLRYAARFGHFTIVRYLARRGADTHARQEYAFRHAAGRGHLNIVKHLVSEWNADVSVANGDAFRYAAREGRLEVVRYLAEFDLDRDDIYFAMRWASQQGRLDVVKFMVKKFPIHMNAGQNYMMGHSAEDAYYAGHYEVLKYLLSDQRVHSLRDYKTKYAIRWAAEEYDHEKFIGLLRKPDYFFTYVPGIADLAMHWATVYGGFDVLKHLDICGGAEKALCWAAQYGHHNIVKFLIEHYAMAKPSEVLTRALDRATYNGHLEVVKELVKHGANIHGATGENGNVIAYAIERGHLDVVEFLVENDMDMKYVNYKRARKCGPLEVREFLEEHVFEKCAGPT
jgi:ankyrin repeat protein